MARGEGEPAERRARWADIMLRGALAIALAAPVLIAAGAIGTRLGLWSWRVGFGLLTVDWAPKAALAGFWFMVLVAVLAGVLAGWRRVARAWPLVAAGLLVPVLTLAGLAGVRAKAQSVPPIHDYATSWSEPVMPTPQLLAARGPNANPIPADPRADLGRGRPEVESWADDRVARIGSEACPAARPAALAVPPAQAQARVREVLDDSGLDVVTEAPGRLEATATSTWYGFKDDVMVRIRPEGAGSRVDFRSVSRVGRSDLGANCERIVELVEALRE